MSRSASRACLPTGRNIRTEILIVSNVASTRIEQNESKRKHKLLSKDRIPHASTLAPPFHGDKNGSAGNSTGPHLHFEVWGTGFYELAEP